MHPDDHRKLFYLTIAMDIPFIAILLTSALTLTIYDTIYCYIVLFTHVVFLLSMHYNITELLEFLHYIVFLLLSAGLGASNVFILSICLFLSTAIQVLCVRRALYFKRAHPDLDPDPFPVRIRQRTQCVHDSSDYIVFHEN